MSSSLLVVTRRDDLSLAISRLLGETCHRVTSVGDLLEEIPAEPPVTLFYDLRDAVPSHLSEEFRQIRERLPTLRLVVVSNGGMTLEQAEHAVRYADDEWDLSEPQVECTVWRHVRAAPGDQELHDVDSVSRPYLEALDLARRVASQPVPVVLSGETGAGKTTLARFLHEWSDRRSEPFTVLACGAVPRDLLEADLFGNVRGAFTSANETRAGRLDAAGKGTLLLDEVDLLGLEQQAKLLRVVESGAYEPVGSTETRHAKCRLIFATNVDLEELVARQKFRSDLFFRINVVDIRLPPLRERSDDIPLLAVRCLREASAGAADDGTRVSLSFLRSLRHYDWPGNIRELKNRLLRARTLARNGHLHPDDLGLLPSSLLLKQNKSAAQYSGLERAIQNTTTKVIEQTLIEHNNNRAAAARALGISRSTLYRKLERLNLNSPLHEFTPAEPT